MQHLFSPWRFQYVTQSKQQEGCVLCRLGAADPEQDEAGLIVHRGEHHFLVLNLYPYTSGHLMIVPYEHLARLSELSDAARNEMITLAAALERLLGEVYRPEGINLGMNLGECAGAGIIEHLHLHAVPRWCGDTSFMTVTGRTRVMPEDLHDTWRKLHGKLARTASGQGAGE
jgi:ATP adenylyltransferase